MEVFNCNGKILDLHRPQIMGIINVTPDSFFSESRAFTEKLATEKVEKMIDQGANIIDIGGVSTRPGSEFISSKEEIRRILPVLRSVRRKFQDIFISIDTFRSEVAKIAIDEGADIINDISSGTLDPEILQIVSSSGLPYIFMHMKGIPKNMQDNPTYQDIVHDVLTFLLEKKRYFRFIGIKQLIADPGFGFGKSIDDNFKLLNNLDVFKILEIPLLAGLSRKSMFYKFLNTSPDQSLNATSFAHTIALMKGAKLLRVHDVKETVEIVKLVEKLNGL
jgi:dihydropteroate synthase